MCWLACGLPTQCVLAGMWPAYLVCVGWHVACLLSICVGWHVACLLSICVLAGMWPAYLVCSGGHVACLLSMCWLACGLPTYCVLAGMWPAYLVCVGWHVACLLSICVGWHVACLLSICVLAGRWPAYLVCVLAGPETVGPPRSHTSLRAGDVSGAWCSGGPRRWPGARCEYSNAGHNGRCSLLLQVWACLTPALWQTWGFPCLQLIWDRRTQSGWMVLWLLSQFPSMENHRSSPWG